MDTLKLGIKCDDDAQFTSFSSKNFVFFLLVSSRLWFASSFCRVFLKIPKYTIFLGNWLVPTGKEALVKRENEQVTVAVQTYTYTCDVPQKMEANKFDVETSARTQASNLVVAVDSFD